ncbi:ABC transporter ATP-binding protein [Spirabiliibacterium mucosae]|uniref:ABC transporter ATP-binding protein n=1 Tax=Spirabiliibacterium mucosae TaxID=28156 RepID=UPI001F430606|nr:ABC transporter ATP-binding protein [Spirabiliibacterium mucosae]
MAVNALAIANLHFAYRDQALFSQFDFTLPQGQWTALLGRSGVGKSTLARILAGLEEASYHALTRQSAVAYLAQNDALFPWLTVLDNVQLHAHLHGQKNAQTAHEAQALLSAVGMAEHGNKFCYQLSGGQRQRVALARTLMQRAEIVIMDEPFSALDAITKYELQALARALLTGRSVLLITHDPQEAIRLADVIYVLQGTPAVLSRAFCPQGHAPRESQAPCHWPMVQALLAQLRGADENPV